MQLAKETANGTVLDTSKDIENLIALMDGLDKSAVALERFAEFKRLVSEYGSADDPFISAQLEKRKQEALQEVKSALGNTKVTTPKYAGDKSNKESSSSKKEDNGLRDLIDKINRAGEEINAQIANFEEQLNLEELLGNTEAVDELKQKLKELYSLRPEVLNNSGKELEALKSKFSKEEDILTIENAMASNYQSYLSAKTEGTQYEVDLINEKMEKEKEAFEQSLELRDRIRKRTNESSSTALAQNKMDISDIDTHIGELRAGVNLLLEVDGMTMESDEVKKVQEEINKLEDDKYDLELKNIDLEFDLSKQVIDEVNKLKDDLDVQLEIAGLKGDTKLELELSASISDLNITTIASIENHIKGIQSIMSTLPKNLAEYKDYEEQINELVKERNSLLKDQLSLIEETAKKQAEYNAYGSQGKDKWLDSNKAEIDALKEQIDLINKKAEAEEKEDEIKNKIEEIDELEKKLKNLQNNKDVQILSKGENGEWQWDYIADYEKVSDTEEQISEKRNELDKIYEDQRKQQQIDAIEEQIAQLESLATTKEEYYKQEYDRLVAQGVKELEEKSNQGTEQKRQTETNFTDIDTATKKGMADVNASTKSGFVDINLSTQVGLQTMSTLYSNWLNTIYENVKTMMQKIRDEMADAPDGSSSGSSNPTSGTSNGSTGWLSSNAESSNTLGFKTGGLNTSTGFQLLHGTQFKPERILSAEQTQAFEKMVNNIEPFNNYMSRILNKNANTNVDNGTTISINTVKLEGVQSPTEFVNELKSCFIGLPQKAKIQKAK